MCANLVPEHPMLVAASDQDNGVLSALENSTMIQRACRYVWWFVDLLGLPCLHRSSKKVNPKAGVNALHLVRSHGFRSVGLLGLWMLESLSWVS